MSQALQNQVNELEGKVKRLTEQVEQLSKLLKPASPDLLQPKRRGRPPNGHMQP